MLLAPTLVSATTLRVPGWSDQSSDPPDTVRLSEWKFIAILPSVEKTLPHGEGGKAFRQLVTGGFHSQSQAMYWLDPSPILV